MAMVQCLRCRGRLAVQVSREELEELKSSRPQKRSCKECRQETSWLYLPLGVSRDLSKYNT
ncbi:MAG: hypothetical protein O6850_01015 [Acidobacteria bacterium]|nr:hypothetical protein [Acidobacteriota bacterium]